MSELYKIYNRSIVQDNKIGVSNKIEIVKKNRQTGIYEKGIFKEKLNYGSKDNVVEAVVYRIACLLGVPCSRAIVIQHNGELGCFSRYEVDSLDNFIHLQEYFGLAEMFVEDFFKAIISMKCNNVKQLFGTAYRYIMLDYLVGQQDRHMENLAFIHNRDRLTFYPLYDNGLALYAQMSNSIYKDRLRSGKFTSRMGNSEEIYMTLKELRKRFSNTPINSIIRIDSLNSGVIDKIIKEEDRYNEITSERRRDMVYAIMIRKEELLKL